MAEYIFLNGEIFTSDKANLKVNDIAILRGYGVFDFFRVVDQKAIFLEDYLDRLERSIAGLSLKMNYSRSFLKEKINELIQLNPHDLLGIRIVCTGGYADDAYTPTIGNVIMIAKPFQFHPYDKGLKLMSVEFQRELYQIKSINYLQPISLLPKLQAIQADDVLYYKNGLVTESSRSNVFHIKNGVLITPNEGMLQGVTRKRILGFASEIMPVEIRPVSLTEILDADEVFLSASTKRISPVTNIDGITFEKGPFTKILYERLIVEESLL